jgi:hypothetical protein
MLIAGGAESVATEAVYFGQFILARRTKSPQLIHVTAARRTQQMRLTSDPQHEYRPAAHEQDGGG